MKQYNIKIAYIALAILIFVMAYFTWRFGMQSQYATVTSWMMLFIALPTMIGAKNSLGWRKCIAVYVWLGVLAIGIESLSVATGFPYGKFSYAEFFNNKVFGLAPITLLFLWPSLAVGAWDMARQLTTKHRKTIMVLLLVCLDLVLDPGAVAMGFWAWENPGAYYGVPFVNFLGWVLTASISARFLEEFDIQIKRDDALLTTSCYLFNLTFFLCIAFFSVHTVPIVIGIILFLYLFTGQARKLDRR